jgi:hypothetical protein
MIYRSFFFLSLGSKSKKIAPALKIHDESLKEKKFISPHKNGIRILIYDRISRI